LFRNGYGNDFQPAVASKQSSLPFEDPLDGLPSDEVGEQLECPDCGRFFNPIPYEKHIKICAKVFLTKRKEFNSAAMRLDPEAIKLLKEKEKEEKRLAKKNAKAAASHADQQVGGKGGRDPKWKEQSNAFREAMRAAREVTKALESGAPLPPPKMSAPDPSLIPCPHCGRSFNQNAADRHIPQCQNIKAKPTMLKRSSGTGIGSRPIASNLNQASQAPQPKKTSSNPTSQAPPLSKQNAGNAAKAIKPRR
jgi:hypothetical protein